MIALLVLPITSANPQPQDPTARLVRFPIAAYDGSLTPYSFESGYALMALVYDTLMWRDEDGEPQPWLASSVKVSDDRRTVMIELNDDIHWHDGRPVTGADVAFTFNFVRAHYHPRFTPQLEAVETVRATGRSSVVIELAHPSPGFEDQPLSDLPIVPKHLWQRLDDDVSFPPGPPIGSGPYRLVSEGQREGYRFRSYDDYFKGAPRVDLLDIPIEDSLAESIDMIQSGDADMLPVPLPDDVAAEVEGLTVATARGPLYAGTLLMLNVRRPPFDDIDVRRAVASGLNLRRIARAAGDSVAAESGYLHPESGWGPDEPLHLYDPVSARRVLGATDLPRSELLVADNNPYAITAGREVMIALRDLGLDLRLKEVRPRRLAEAVGQNGSTAEFDAAIWSSPALASYDPDFLRPLFGSHAHANLNYSGYSSKEFDAAALRVATTTDGSERKRHVIEELTILADDAPHIPLFFAQGAFAYRPSTFDGWRFITGSGILDKQSFLPDGASPRDPAAADHPPQDPGPPTAGDDGSGEINPLGAGALGLLALALLLGAAAVTIRR